MPVEKLPITVTVVTARDMAATAAAARLIELDAHDPYPENPRWPWASDIHDTMTIDCAELDRDQLYERARRRKEKAA